MDLQISQSRKIALQEGYFAKLTLFGAISRDCIVSKWVATVKLQRVELRERGVSLTVPQDRYLQSILKGVFELLRRSRAIARERGIGSVVHVARSPDC